MFDDATTGHLLRLIDESPLGTVVDISILAGELTIGLPFETLTSPDGRPLVLVPGVRLTRRLVGVERQATAPLPGPLKILAAVAGPDETSTDNAPLDVEAEMQAVLDATSDLDGAAEVQVRILEVASLPEITAALKQDQYHVLHLSAHGNRTGIELENEDGEATFASTEALITAVRAGGHGLPLIVLSSCAGADGGVDGLAASLITRGADRVLGMQATVTDPYATEFARRLYQSLAGDPDATVGQALAAAR
ncbi:MAG: hypothetical protein QOE53_832, partial [Pseudonocardiales bacterium]|nr:hypothetical protein [Pseudonocardiales bacterium]